MSSRHDSTSPYRGGVDDFGVEGWAMRAQALMFDSNSTSQDQKRGATSRDVQEYIVQEGDVLGLIAEEFGVSVNTIIWANDLTGSAIRPGQKLSIPPVSGIRHTIKSGDTLGEIVERYGGKINEVRSFNNIENDGALKVGQYIFIPGGQAAQGASAAASRVVAINASSGWLMRPIKGGVRSQGLHGYNAVDLAVSHSDYRNKTEYNNVYAAAAGTVVTAKANGAWNGGYGNYVVIKHSNGVQTLYSHLGLVTASQGAWVEQGQKIGDIGMTGRTTGPHLHFEVRGATNPF